jgi:hypothetical protein
MSRAVEYPGSKCLTPVDLDLSVTLTDRATASPAPPLELLLYG